MSDETQQDFGDDEYSVYRKLMAVQKGVEAIPKDVQNSKMGFDYASSSAVLAKIRGLMDDLGLLLLFNVVEHEVMKETAYKGKQALTVINVEATWVDAENPASQVTLRWPGQGADDGEKGVGKAMTYMEKYGLLKNFHIPTDEVDPDGDVSPEMENAPTCSKCGKPMAIREGKRGKFWGCTGYPDCKNTMPFNEEAKEEEKNGGGNKKSTVTTSKTRPEDRDNKDKRAKQWDETWKVIKQVRGVEKGDKETVKAMKQWAKKHTDGEVEGFSDWTPEMIIRFRGAVEKQAQAKEEDD